MYKTVTTKEPELAEDLLPMGTLSLSADLFKRTLSTIVGAGALDPCLDLENHLAGILIKQHIIAGRGRAVGCMIHG